MAEAPSKKKRFLVWCAVWLGIAGAVLLVVLLMPRTGFFARSMGEYVNRRFFTGTPFSVSMERLQGNPFGDVTIKGFKLRYRAADTSFDVFRLDELRCRFDVASIAGKRPLIEELAVVKPILRLKADSTGHYLLPSLGAGGGAFPDFLIERFSIRDGHAIVQARQSSDAVNNVQMRGSLRSGGTGLVLRIDGCSAEDPGRNLSIERLTGSVIARKESVASGAARGYRISFDSLAVELEESSLLVTGTFVPRSRTFDGTISANPLNVEEAARVLGRDMSQHVEVEGLFTARGTPDRFTLRGTMNGLIGGYAVSDFKFGLHRQKHEVLIDTMSGYLNGAAIDGSGKYREAAPRTAFFDLSVRNLDLSKGFVPNEKLPETDFNGTVSVQYRVPEGDMAFSLNLGEGHFRRFPFQTAAIRGTYARDTLALAEVLLTHPTHTVSARGTVVGREEVDFYFNVDCKAQDPLFRYFDIEKYRGDAILNGIWKGTVDAFDLRLSGSCANLAYEVARIPKGTLKLAIRKNSHYNVLFDLEGQGCDIGPARFSGVVLSLEYEGGVTRIKKLTLSRKDLLAEAAADVSREGESHLIRVRELSLEALGEQWVSSGRFAILLGDSLVRFDDLQLHSKAGALYAEGIVAHRARSCDVRVGFERFALGRLNDAGLVALRLAGTARGLVRCSGALDDPNLNLDLGIESGRIDTFAIDSLRCRIDYAAGRSVIDSFFVSSPSGSLRMGGELSGASLPALVRHRGAGIRDAVVRVGASCRNLMIPPLLGLAGNRTFRGGRFSGTVAMTDSLVHPFLEVTGTVVDLTVSSFTMPVIDCSAAIDGGALTINGVVHVAEKKEGSFRGNIPLGRAAFFYTIARDRPLSFEVDVPDGDFAGLADITDFVAEGAGTYVVRLTVSGTAANPSLRGDLSLGNVSCRLAGMEERYSQVNARILLEDSLITVSSMSGREGKKGTFDLGGAITLRGWKPGRYDLTARFKEFALASMPNVMAIVSGTLTVSTRVDEGRTLPVLSGSCEVTASEVYYDLGSFSSQEAGPTLQPKFVAAVDCKIPGNTWIKTPDAQVELQGNVTIYHDNRGTYLRGELDLVRGWYNVYNNKFQIISGKLQFVHAGGFRPVVDIEAETRDPEGRSIFLTMRWHQDDVEPKLSLRHEDPGYSETDIWKMLGGGIVSAPDAQGASWDARGTAQNIAANFMERVLNSQMQGVTIELESSQRDESVPSGALDSRETRIAIGKYLSQGLYVKYKQGLSVSTARQIEVEYRISNLFLIRSEVIRYSDKVLQGKSPWSSDEINMDVKLRWEF